MKKIIGVIESLPEFEQEASCLQVAVVQTSFASKVMDSTEATALEIGHSALA